MINIKITYINPNILEDAIRISNDKNPYTTVYRLNDGRIFKCLKRPIIKCNRDLMESEKFYNFFCAKLEKADSLRDIEELVLPEEMAIDKKGKVVGYYYKYEDMNDTFSFLQKTNDFNRITKYFKILLNETENLHKRQIIVPDLITPSNVLYDEKKEIIRLIDYDGLQIEDIPSYAISRKLNVLQNPVLKSSKYKNSNGLYTSKIDDFSILLDYLFQLTGLNVSGVKAFQKFYVNEWDRVWNRINKEQITSLFNRIGIDDEEIITGYINLFSGREENLEVKTIIDKISSEYESSDKVLPDEGFKVLQKRVSR